ncbi:MAG TPA: ABC transporter ATP-binding protein [Clostridiales bacterium]|nr:ABC transporter ATP-binding protein [Clostridiales bacterium]HCV70164.1 ABC transporter ATP-binding protein [Clostridiales bacterium]
MLSLIGQNWTHFLWALIATIMMVIIGFLTPLLLSEIVDSILGSEPFTMPDFLMNPINALGGRDFLRQNLWIPALALILMNVVNGVFTFIKGRSSAIASENIARKLRNDLYRHLQHLPFAYHVKAQAGELIQRCTSDVDTIRRFLAVQVMEVVNTVLMVVIAMSILLPRSVPITLYSLILVPPLFCFATWFFKMVHKSFEVADEADGVLNAVLQENLSGVRVVRAFGQQEREVEKFDRVNNDLRKKNLRLNELLAIYWGGGDAISMTQTLLTLVVCIIYACNGWITVGTLIVFTSTLGMLLFPIRQLGRTLSDAGKAMVSMKRVQAILHEKAEPDEPNALKPDLHGDIVFDHVSFAYPDDNVPVLRDVSFTIPAGKTAAVLGGTGSGKSTMMYLLQRLYAPTSGKITIGGVDIQQIDRKYLRAHVGLILQEPFLYSKSIRENVGITAPEQEAERIEHAADIASASGFIAKADKGWETVVGERGVTLSGGQKQRIAIARTLLKDNNILIFDDSLSAVDTETDAQIRAALRHEQKDVTTLIISHRVTTLSQADLILVLENGQITQQGTHAELCSQPGLYQRINSIQNALEEELTQAKAAEGVN